MPRECKLATYGIERKGAKTQLAKDHRPPEPLQAPFGSPAAAGDALLLGFDSPIAGLVIRLRIESSRAEGSANPGDPPLQWEASVGNGEWEPAVLVSDETGGFTYGGGGMTVQVPEGFPDEGNTYVIEPRAGRGKVRGLHGRRMAQFVTSILSIRAARKAGKPVAICGEMAGDWAATRLLLGMGLTQFSMHPASLLRVKQEILKTDTSKLLPRVARLHGRGAAPRVAPARWARGSPRIRPGPRPARRAARTSRDR